MEPPCSLAPAHSPPHLLWCLLQWAFAAAPAQRAHQLSQLPQAFQLPAPRSSTGRQLYAKLSKLLNTGAQKHLSSAADGFACALLGPLLAQGVDFPPPALLPDPTGVVKAIRPIQQAIDVLKGLRSS